MKNESIETSTSHIWVEDGIRFDEIKPESMITLEHAQEVVSAYIKSTKGEAVPTLVDMTHIKSMGREAREFFTGRQAEGVIKNMAILVSTPVSEITAGLFVTLSKPQYPVKIFTSEEEAIGWLRS